ncbi:flavin reductase [Bizionia argentinensis JUB59]|uniref:Flavin reductase n=1 Tax=Bizionia argentinensis JUB59 TaxID=1046627 RepID=G2ECH0_9FLAO|nr:flavin reductase [Bizionia argentinensis]EGV43873.2 flavin reductase [Bizionia argentinensis JUB59]
MTRFSHQDISEMEHLYKINLINSCSGFKSANLIGSKSADGFENVAIFSSVTHIGSQPPLLGVLMRPTTVARNTYDNIKETGFYTINHVHEAIINDAHHTSAKYDKSISEFDMTTLKSEYKAEINVPFVKSAPVQMHMEFVEEYYIKANDTILVIGKIIELFIQNDLLEADGFVNLSKGQIAAINGLDGYAIPLLKNRLDYQRPKSILKT